MNDTLVRWNDQWRSVFAGLDPPLLSRNGSQSGQMFGIFTTLSAAGRRNGRWSACLVPLPNCGKLAGGQHWALEADPGSKLGVNKTMSLVGSRTKVGPTVGQSCSVGVSLSRSSSSSFHASAASITITQKTRASVLFNSNQTLDSISLPRKELNENFDTHWGHPLDSGVWWPPLPFPLLLPRSLSSLEGNR